MYQGPYDEPTRDSETVWVSLSRRSARALLAAANRELTDDPGTHGKLDRKDLGRAADTLGFCMGGGRS